MPELPRCVQLAAEKGDLEDFLEDVQLGFHWDVLDRMEDGVYLIDLDRRIRYWSQGAEQITGFSAEEVVGSSCADDVLCHVDEHGTHLCEEGCPLRAIMQDGQPRGAEVFLHHKAGHRVPVRVFGAAIYSPLGDR